MANFSSISANSWREQILKMYFLNNQVYIVQIKEKLKGGLGKNNQQWLCVSFLFLIPAQ